MFTLLPGSLKEINNTPLVIDCLLHINLPLSTEKPSDTKRAPKSSFIMHLSIPLIAAIVSVSPFANAATSNSYDWTIQNSKQVWNRTPH